MRATPTAQANGVAPVPRPAAAADPRPPQELVTPGLDERLPGDTLADEAGLRAAFLAHGAELYGFARRFLRGADGAEDAVQETFARAWRSRSRFDPSLGTLRAWLFAIERRVLLDHLAKQGRQHPDRLGAALHERRGAEDEADAALRGWQVAEALRHLDPGQRRVVVELYVHGRSSREVADLFGIPDGTVRSRAFYALRSLRRALEAQGWTP